MRENEGLSTKVLNQCLRKHVRYGILDKQRYQELPPRVEYEVTAFGTRFISLLEQIEDLEAELE